MKYETPYDHRVSVDYLNRRNLTNEDKSFDFVKEKSNYGWVVVKAVLGIAYRNKMWQSLMGDKIEFFFFFLNLTKCWVRKRCESSLRGRILKCIWKIKIYKFVNLHYFSCTNITMWHQFLKRQRQSLWHPYSHFFKVNFDYV